MADVPRYRFGPLERRGVLAGLRASQLVILGSGGLLIVAVARTLPPTAALSAMLVIGLLVTFAAFVPMGGRALDEWLPVVGLWAFRGALGDRRFVSRAPVDGLTAVLDPQPQFPASLRGVTILSHAVPGSDARIGVVKDARAATFTGVLSVD